MFERAEPRKFTEKFLLKNQPWLSFGKDQSLRILTFASLFPSRIDPSYGIFVFQRSAYLAKVRENDVVVVSPVPYFPRWVKTRGWQKARALASQETVGELTVYHPRYFLIPKVFMPFHGLSMFLGCLRRIVALHREKKIDCIDAHFVYPDGFAAVLVGKILGVPVTVSARGTDINVYPAFRLIRPLIRWTLQESAGLIAVSRALKERMVALGVSEERIFVVPNGVDTARFRPTATQEARRRLGLAEEGPLLVAVGALIAAKGHQLLIRAFSQIAPKHPGLRLYILGEGTYRRELERLLRELGLQERVLLPGKRPNDELPLWFSAASASCLSSSREGWPNVITESLACGTPVVATRVGGIPEILYSSEFGVLVNQTVESIAAGMEHALSKEWDREAISTQAHMRTWHTVAVEVEQVLARTLR
jgi:teichuronic acid biosynthesis glycosyltransferase TuaC